jgi:actin-related protein
MFENLTDRLKSEIVALAYPASEVRIIPNAQKKHSAWMGAAILGCSSCCKVQWVTAKHYQEYGASVINFNH